VNRKEPFVARLKQVVREDARYDLNAYTFLFEALGFTLRMLGRSEERGDPSKRHVTGRELLEGIKRHALQQFGFMARVVLEGWGVKTTDDFGEIVFNLVDRGLLGRSETDSKEDFHAVYDFRQALDLSYQIGGEARLTQEH